MPAKMEVKFKVGQTVEVGQGRGNKPVLAEIIAIARQRVGSHAYYRMSMGIHEIKYKIHYLTKNAGEPVWVDQTKIRRVQPEPTQEQLEAKARRLFGEDYL